MTCWKPGFKTVIGIDAENVLISGLSAERHSESHGRISVTLASPRLTETAYEALHQRP